MPPSEAQVWAALRPVADPELDQSVVELGFVHEVSIEGDTVAVAFRLPTFWCSANFAYIMAEDMRAALLALPGVARVRISLVDHFAASRINAGIEQGQDFRAVFGAEAADGLDKVRQTFKEKALLGRQAALIQELRQREWGAARITELTVGELAALPPSEAQRRYLEALDVAEPKAPAFVDATGQPIAAAGLLDHLRQIRRVRMSAEANGEMCRILLEARYGRTRTNDTTAPQGASA